jgi:hypothetical protein
MVIPGTGDRKLVQPYDTVKVTSSGCSFAGVIWAYLPKKRDNRARANILITITNKYNAKRKHKREYKKTGMVYIR